MNKNEYRKVTEKLTIEQKQEISSNIKDFVFGNFNNINLVLSDNFEYEKIDDKLTLKLPNKEFKDIEKFIHGIFFSLCVDTLEELEKL